MGGREGAAEKGATAWVGELGRRHYLDFHMNDWVTEFVANVDPDAQAQMFVEAGIQAIGFFFKDHYGNCSYFTEIGRRHPHLTWDYAGDMTIASKARGLKVIAYYSVGVDRYTGLNHPTWQMRDRHGRARPGAWVKERGIGGSPCINTPYTEKVMLPEIAEIAERYPVDGYLLDMATWQVAQSCYCRFCKRDFRKETGEEIPKDPDDPLAFTYRMWRNRHNQELERKVRETLDAVRPGIALGSNAAYGVGFPEPVSPYVDFLFRDPGQFYPLTFSMFGRYFTTLGMPFEMENPPSLGWGDYALRPTVALKQECAVNLIVGSTVSMTDQPYADGSLVPAVYEAIKDVFEFVEERESYTLGSRSEPYVALLHCSTSHWAKAPLDGGYWPPDHIRGAHRALVESGVHFDIVNQSTLEKTIDGYSTVVMPEQTSLPESTVACIREFVRGGGGLVATGGVATRDGENRPLDGSALADVLGIEMGGSLPYRNVYLRAGMELLEGGRFHDMALSVVGSGFQTRLAGAELLGALVEPIGSWLEAEDEPERYYTTRDTPPPGSKSDLPGITVNRFGAGLALYIAADLFASYGRDNVTDLKHLARRCLEFVTPPERRKLEVDCPPSVEVSLRRNGEDLLLQLVNFHAEKRQEAVPVMEWLPRVGPIPARIRCEKPERIVLIPDETPLDWAHNDGILSFELPAFELYAGASIKFQNDGP